MSLLVWLLILMMMKMKNGAASAEIITARSGEAVQLTADLQGLEHRKDVRWTHPHLVVSLKNNKTTCHHGRCEMLKDGSLSFSQVQTADSGNYSLEVFDEGGILLKKRDFLLRVEDTSSSSTVVVLVLICCFLLLLFFFIFIVLRRRKKQKTRTAGPVQENVYVAMHSYHGNKRKNEEQKLERDEFSYVPCSPAVSMETPITQQMSVDAEDIYV